MCECVFGFVCIWKLSNKMNFIIFNNFLGDGGEFELKRSIFSEYHFVCIGIPLFKALRPLIYN